MEVIALLKANLQEAGRQVAILEKTMRETPATPKETPSAGFGIFNPILNEEQLAKCFYRLYRRYFGAGCKATLQGKCDELTFSIYLYILVERDGLGRADFGERCRKPFYEFIRSHVIPDLTQTARTFHNRLEKLAPLRQALTKNNLPPEVKMRWECNEHYRNFYRIQEDYHNSSFHHNLNRLT